MTEKVCELVGGLVNCLILGRIWDFYSQLSSKLALLSGKSTVMPVRTTSFFYASYDTYKFNEFLIVQCVSGCSIYLIYLWLNMKVQLLRNGVLADIIAFLLLFIKKSNEFFEL